MARVFFLLLLSAALPLSTCEQRQSQELPTRSSDLEPELRLRLLRREASGQLSAALAEEQIKEGYPPPDAAPEKLKGEHDGDTTAATKKLSGGEAASPCDASAPCPAPKPCPRPCPPGASNGAEEPKVLCPTTCGEKKCKDGPKSNGGLALIRGVCTARCSGESESGERYCGEGQAYEGCDSVDCGSCVPGPAPPTNRPTKKPTPCPSCVPTPCPTPCPSCQPTPCPTSDPTEPPAPPTCAPTPCPTKCPTPVPTECPSPEPTCSDCPTPRPPCPTGTPTAGPTHRPTFWLPPAPRPPPCKGPCGQPKQSYCPAACISPTCIEGALQNGGMKLEGPGSTTCLGRCSRSDVSQSQRHCGLGPEYEGGDSLDCSACHPGVAQARAAKVPPNAACAPVCRAPNCQSGSPDNGGAILMNGMCTTHCSRSDIYGGLRYCGIGKEYEDGDSVDCTQCIPSFDGSGWRSWFGLVQERELELHGVYGASVGAPSPDEKKVEVASGASGADEKEATESVGASGADVKNPEQSVGADAKKTERSVRTAVADEKKAGKPKTPFSSPETKAQKHGVLHHVPCPVGAPCPAPYFDDADGESA